MNPQIENEIQSCVKVLREGGFIIFPNEIGWCIGCLITDSDSVSLLASQNYDHGAVLLEDEGKLNKYVRELPDTIWDLIRFSTKPLSLLLADALNLPQPIVQESGEAMFRIPKDEFTNTLLKKAGRPIFAALLPSQLQPTRETLILNKPGFVVNLRLSQKSTPEQLVIIRLAPSGRIQFIKK